MDPKTPQWLAGWQRAAVALLSASVLLAVAGCNPWRRPAAPPSQPAKPTSPPSQPSAGAPQAEQRAEAETKAADLFNRGENDLACEQVQRALGSQATTPISEQLKRFQQACTPN